MVITGEGRLDQQTAAGKAPWGVALAARAAGKPVIAISGSLGDQSRWLENSPFSAVEAVVCSPTSTQQALEDAESALVLAAVRVGRWLKLSTRLEG